MRPALPLSTIVALLAGVAVAWAQGIPSWDWQLSEPLDLTRSVTYLDTDPDSVSAAQIAGLKAQGVTTICYVSVGTLENYRNDLDTFPARVVGKTYGDWPDERFLDIRALDVLIPIMKARFQRCKDLGFDAIEPDNMDVYTNDSGFDLGIEDTLTYILILAQTAHDMGLQIGQKNVPELTEYLSGSLDFIITEDCFVDGWCGEALPYPIQGKPFLAAEYTDTGVNWAKACNYAKNNGISMILKDRDLGAGLKTCP